MRWGSILISVLCVLALGGCSYRPLYGTSSDDRGVVAELASISIPEAESRLGQIIRNDLLSAMRPAGTETEDRYRLDLKLSKSRSAVIDKKQPNETRSSINVAVDFVLLDGSKEVYSGKTFSQVSYDVVRQPFADTQAENDATERVAHEISADIKTRLAAYFATR